MYSKKNYFFLFFLLFFIFLTLYVINANGIVHNFKKQDIQRYRDLVKSLEKKSKSEKTSNNKDNSVDIHVNQNTDVKSRYERLFKPKSNDHYMEKATPFKIDHEMEIKRQRDAEKLLNNNNNNLRFMSQRDDDDECENDSDCPHEVCMYAVCGKKRKKSKINTCNYTPIDCSDSNPCTTNERCENDQCISDIVQDCCTNDDQCFDNDPCTTNERCDMGSHKCIYDPVPGCCSVIEDCEMFRPNCYDALCVANTCLYNPRDCSDNLPCTENERCVMDECMFDPVPDCCENNGDCQDDNPCIIGDYCDTNTGMCHFIDVDGCCQEEYDCIRNAPVCQIGTCNGDNECDFEPRDCKDEDPCTINEYCDPYTNQCRHEIAPGCEPSPCIDCCAHNPLFAEQIVIANRGNITATLIYADTEEIRSTLIFEPNSEPLYVNSPGCCGGDSMNGQSEYVWIGDRGESKVRKYDARTLEQVDALPTCLGVFHQYYHLVADQMWVICDIDKGMTVIELSTDTVLQHFVPIPADLQSQYKPHDITMTKDYALVALLGSPDPFLPSYIIKYSVVTFSEVDRVQVPANAHVFHSGIPGDFLFTASQQGNKLSVIDIDTFAILDDYDVPGAHGIWEQGGVIYVGNIGAMDPTGTILLSSTSPLNVPNSLWVFTFAPVTGVLTPLPGTPYNLTAENPHNIVPTFSRDKLFIDHTASNQLSVCDLQPNGEPIEPCRLVHIPEGFVGVPERRSAGLKTPMGIARLKPLCDCNTACFDFDPCTIHEYCDQNLGICRYDVDPDCDIPDCPHNVNITITDCSELIITEKPNHIYEFCHTSSFLGEDSAVVLSFDPYVDCELNERGTCDNRKTVHDQPEYLCLTDALYEHIPCSLVSGDHAFTLRGFEEDFVWNATFNVVPTMNYDENVGTAHIQGIISGVQNPDIILKVDLWFDNALPLHQLPVDNSPLSNLPPICYTESGGELNRTNWRYFMNVHGSFSGLYDTPYAGLSIAVGTANVPFQLGFGANDKNDNYGFGGWFTWLVVNQPHNQFLHVDHPITVGEINVDVIKNCTLSIDYCELFGEPQEQPANQWKVTLNGMAPHQNLTYCRDFTIEDLLACRAYDHPNTRLFDSVQDHETYEIVYNGTLFANTLLPYQCEYHDIDGICGEQRVIDTKFDIKISIDATGTISVDYITKSINLQVKWLKNVWLMGNQAGNIKVIIETKILHYEQSYPYEPTTKLIDGMIDTSKETGYPLHVVDPNPPCYNKDNYCIQQWELISVNAKENNIEDFSGLKPLLVTVEINGDPRQQLTIYIDLKAKHIGSQQHLQGTVDSSLQLYLDEHFQYPYYYNPHKPLYDCSRLCGLLQLENQKHLKLKTQKVYICYLTDGNIPAYDPEHPDTTGCSTPGAVHRLIYSTDPYDQPEPEHDFEFVFDPPYFDFQNGFCFQVHALTYYKQILQIHWHAEEVGGEGGTIERIVEYYMDDGSKSYRHYDDDYEQNADYNVHCPDNHEYSFDLHKCVVKAGYDHHDDDDDSGHYPPPKPPSHYPPNKPPHYPSNPPNEPHYGYHDDDDSHHHKKSNGYYYDDDNYDVWIVVFIVLLIILIIGLIFYFYGIIPQCCCCYKSQKPVYVYTTTPQQQQQQNITNLHIDDRDTHITQHNNVNNNKLTKKTINLNDNSSSNSTQILTNRNTNTSIKKNNFEDIQFYVPTN